ncbi:MAG: PIG-L deacetylase family protein [Acidimicrobiales bacterium]
MAGTTPALVRMPEDWERALAVVAHPDDLEYGAAAAIARWTGQGKNVRYVLATRGEAGIDTMPPERAGPVRTAEQIAGAAEVGVTVVEFLDHPDGLLQNDLALRHDLTRAIRRHRPELIISSSFRERWGPTGPYNHADHRALGLALIDATRDAANRWLFTDAGERWDGVRWLAFAGSTEATHAVDVTDHIDSGVASLRCHRAYLEALDGDVDPDAFLRGAATDVGPRLGVDLAVAFELVPT